MSQEHGVTVNQIRVYSLLSHTITVQYLYDGRPPAKAVTTVSHEKCSSGVICYYYYYH